VSEPTVVKLRPRRRKRAAARPEGGWGLIGEAVERLGLSREFFAHAARRSFAVACHRLVPRLEPHARAEALDAEGKTLVVRVSSSAVASELVYVKDLLLQELNAQLGKLLPAPAQEGGKRSSRKIRPPRVDRLQYRVAPVKSLPDYAAWSAAPPPRELPQVPPTPFRLEVAAELKRVPDAETRDALAALYAAATGAGARKNY
jgi:hypothetical protein